MKSHFHFLTPINILQLMFCQGTIISFIIAWHKIILWYYIFWSFNSDIALLSFSRFYWKELIIRAYKRLTAIRRKVFLDFDGDPWTHYIIWQCSVWPGDFSLLQPTMIFTFLHPIMFIQINCYNVSGSLSALMELNKKPFCS